LVLPVALALILIEQFKKINDAGARRKVKTPRVQVRDHPLSVQAAKNNTVNTQGSIRSDGDKLAESKRQLSYFRAYAMAVTLDFCIDFSHILIEGGRPSPWYGHLLQPRPLPEVLEA
jgi:hypothetical protein